MKAETSVQDFYNLSVRARFAYGMYCIEKALAQNGINNNLLQEVVDKAWQFTELTDVDEWADEIKEYMPWGILDPYPGTFEENDFITIEKAVQLKELYSQIPKFIVEMFDEVLFIVLDNLYGGFSNNSNIGRLVNVIKLMNNMEVQLPPVTSFSQSTFSEKGGWGIEHPRLFYLGET